MGDMWCEMAAAWKEDSYHTERENNKRKKSNDDPDKKITKVRKMDYSETSFGDVLKFDDNQEEQQQQQSSRGRGNYRGNFRGNDRGNFRGNFRGNPNFRGNFRGNSRGNFRGNNRCNFRGNIRGNFRGNGNPNFRGKHSHPFHPKPMPIVASCEVCNKDFKRQNDYEQHISEHTTCPAANCNYTAHFMLVEQHFQTVHTLKLPGIEKTWNLDTPEKIEEWRQERRKKYPKSEDVKKASDEREKKNKEYLEKKRLKNEEMMLAAAERHMKMLEKKEQEQKEADKVQNDENLENSEIGEKLLDEPVEKDLEDYLVKTEVTSVESTPENQKHENTEKCMDSMFIPDRLMNDDPANIKQWPPNGYSIQDDLGLARPDHYTMKLHRTDPKSYKKVGPTLLQSLLKTDIQRERNILIQCIEHTVKNNFYQQN